MRLDGDRILSRIIRPDDERTSRRPGAGVAGCGKGGGRDRHPPRQAPLFTFGERAELIRASVTEALPSAAGEIEVVSFDNLVVDAARAHGATLLIRGLRDGTDLDYEMQMAGMNGSMAPDVDTVFLGASAGCRHIAASLVRQIARMGGDVSAFVPAAVARRLKEING